MKHLLILLLAIVLLVPACFIDSEPSPMEINSSYSSLVSVGDFMYRVTSSKILTFDISDPSDPVQIDKQIVGFEIESIFHFDGILFVGSGEALHIFEIKEEGIPERRSQTNYSEFDENQTPCDPVVSDGTYAYVTLSSTVFVDDSPCNRAVPVNELRIYDVTDLAKPKEVNRIEMQGPKGLTVDGNNLFVCDGENGLLVYDVSDIENLVELHHFEGYTTRDAIARDGLLIVIASDQLLQYDYNIISDMSLLSTLDL